MSLIKQIDKEKLPKHIAIIMDGNGRWAQQKGEDRIFGHQAGVASVRATTEAAAEVGIKYLTLYAFSTENWNRPIEEINALMSLLADAIINETETLLKNNIRLQVIGDISKLHEDVKAKLEKCIQITSKGTGLTLILALSYSSKWEIIKAVKDIASDVKEDILKLDEISDNLFKSYLSTSEYPDPELLIRTSGERRISNFLLYQLAYSELYFTETHWPDFRKDEFYNALIDYQNRERRFGKTSAQVQTKQKRN